MEKEAAETNESMKAIQRRLDEVERNEHPDFAPGGNAKAQDADQDRMNPAAMAGAASGTDSDSGIATGTGVDGHVGGTATENDYS